MGTIYDLYQRTGYLRFSEQFSGQYAVDFAAPQASVDNNVTAWQKNSLFHDNTAKKILVIDDCPVDRNLLNTFLHKFGYDILEAVDGEEGIAIAQAEKPDLIILDVVMPRMNGFKVCRTLKSIPELAQTPVFLLTSKSEQSDKFWGKSQGADVYLTKPFDPDMLLKAVFRYLSKHLLLRYEREARRQERKKLAAYAMTA
jgi:twitching motility two-component system response regulator PilH